MVRASLSMPRIAAFRARDSIRLLDGRQIVAQLQGAEQKTPQNRELSIYLHGQKALISYLPIRVTDASTRVQRTPFVSSALDGCDLLSGSGAANQASRLLRETEFYKNRKDAGSLTNTQFVID